MLASEVQPSKSYVDLFNSKYPLRDYQVSGNNKIRNAFAKFSKVLYQSPTGTGKSVQIAHIALALVDKGKRPMIICPNDDLIDNLLKYFNAVGVSTGIIQGQKYTNWFAKVFIASAATIHRRLDHFNVKVDFIIWDEVHHIKAETWLKTAMFFSNLYHLGFTATPVRLDGKGFDDVFETIQTAPTIKWFIDKGYLASYDILTLPYLAGVKLKIRGGDYDLKQQSELLDNPTIVGGLVEHWFEHAYDQSTLVFAPSIEMSKNIVNQYNEWGQKYYGHDIAVHLDGHIKRDQKIYKDGLSYYQYYKRAFEEREILIVSTVDLFIEGVDFPGAKCGQIVRLTKSFQRHSQMIGRLLRPKPGKTALFLDHVGAFGEHGLPTDPIKWHLKGVEKLKDYEFCCFECGRLLHEDIRELRKTTLREIICPDCDTVNPIIRVVKGSGGFNRREYELDTDQKLERLTLSGNELKINKLAKEREKRDHKKGWVVAKSFDIQGLTLNDLKFLCSVLDYTQGYAVLLWDAYKNIYTKKYTTRGDWDSAIGRASSNNWLADLSWEKHEDYLNDFD